MQVGEVERRAAALVRGALLAAALLGAAPSSARAEPASCTGDAEALFRCGKRLLDAGHLQRACEALAESDAKEPSVGTLGLLAACHEKQGRLATALSHYETTAARASSRGDARERYALERAAALRPRVPKLVVKVASGESPLVWVGSRTLRASEIGGEILVDPGEVRVTARAGDESFESSVSVVEGERRVVAIPRLLPLPSPGASGGGPPAEAWASGVVGVVGLLTMGVAGGIAVSANDASKSYEVPCRGGDALACESGASARSDATTAAHVGTAGFVVGAVGLGLGVLFWALDDDAPPTLEAALSTGRGAPGGPLLVRF